MIVGNGKVRGKQRYKCKDCGLNFVDGDQRVKGSVSVIEAEIARPGSTSVRVELNQKGDVVTVIPRR